MNSKLVENTFWATYFKTGDTSETRIFLKDFMLSLPTEELFAFTKDNRQERVSWFRSKDKTAAEKQTFLTHLDTQMAQYLQKAA
jgi:hypothetical protein